MPAQAFLRTCMAARSFWLSENRAHQLTWFACYSSDQREVKFSFSLS